MIQIEAVWGENNGKIFGKWEISDFFKNIKIFVFPMMSLLTFIFSLAQISQNLLKKDRNIKMIQIEVVWGENGAKHSSPSLHLAAPSGKIGPYNIIYGISMFLQKSTRQWLIIVMLWISALGFVYQCNFLNLQKLFDYIKNCWRKIEEHFSYGFIG